MARCACCQRVIVMGGRTHDGDRYCGDDCYRSAVLVPNAAKVPPDVVMAEVMRLRSSACGKCGGPGPIDLYSIHSVWSALVLTRWKSKQMFSCPSCARKAAAGASVANFLLGWWGFPWGLLMTPVQMVRNLETFRAAGKNAPEPSEAMRMAVLATLAERMARTPVPRQLHTAQVPALPPPEHRASAVPPPLPPHS